jgi:hypothetical protein
MLTVGRASAQFRYQIRTCRHVILCGGKVEPNIIALEHYGPDYKKPIYGSHCSQLLLPMHNRHVNISWISISHPNVSFHIPPSHYCTTAADEGWCWCVDDSQAEPSKACPSLFPSPQFYQDVTGETIAVACIRVPSRGCQSDRSDETLRSWPLLCYPSGG